MSQPNLQDYNLQTPITQTHGLRRNLPNTSDAHFSLFLRKAFIKSLGYTDEALSKPLIGIINTYSALNPCHANVPALVEAAKRGVHMAGGLAVEFPTVSIHESFVAPTSMFLRNLMSMDTEEMVGGQPIDACVMIGGCDKTVPAQIMGGLSANKPIIPLLTGPMLPGSFRGTRIGACTDCRSNWAAYRAGSLDIEDIAQLNEELAPTAGTCGVMGTASTMAALTAALGLIPLHIPSATAPAVSSARLRVAEYTGSLAVDVFRGERTPASVLSLDSFYNAVVVLQATGGSTNGIIHILAIANRHPSLAGKVTLKMIDDIGRETPLLVDLKPSGENYMSDFHNAGGMLALLHTLRPLLRTNAMTITGQTLSEVLDSNPFTPFPFSTRIIRPLDNPLHPSSSLVVLYGNMAPKGAVLKASASKYKNLLQHRGRAIVFAGSEDLANRIDAPDLDVDENSVLILQGIGPRGLTSPGMPEAGLIPIPRKLAAKGVKDMLRISDGRMSGTAGGTIILHVSPEAASPHSVFGILRDGDVVVCNVENRRLDVELTEVEIQARFREQEAALADETPALRRPVRGYRGLYERFVTQAEEGVDFSFLRADGAESFS